jgi:hypothetical protein
VGPGFDAAAAALLAAAAGELGAPAELALACALADASATSGLSGFAASDVPAGALAASVIAADGGVTSVAFRSSVACGRLGV